MRPRQLFALMVLYGTAALVGGGAARLGVFDLSGIENIATPIGDRGATSAATSLSAYAGGAADAPLASAMASLASALASRAAVGMSHLERPEPAVAPAAMSVGKSATADPDPAKTAFVTAGFSAAEVPVVEVPLPDSVRRRRPKHASSSCPCPR